MAMWNLFLTIVVCLYMQRITSGKLQEYIDNLTILVRGPKVDADLISWSIVESLYKNDSASTVYDSWDVSVGEYFNNTVTIQTLPTRCYTFTLIFSELNDQYELEYQRPWFNLWVNSIILTLPYQTFSYDDLTTWIYICPSLFDLNNLDKKLIDSSDNNNKIKIEFETYPENLILQILTTESDDDGSILYENNFGKIAFDQFVLENNSLVFRNLTDGCYQIKMIDQLFDSLTSSLSHAKYKLSTTDNIVINYGGYFGEEETNIFCTNNTNYCIVPYQCQNKTFCRYVKNQNAAFFYCCQTGR